MKAISILYCSAVIALCMPSLPARAAVDTFSFTNEGYFTRTDGSLLPVKFAGQFTGTPEANGLIEEADLSTFFAVTIPAIFAVNIGGFSPGGALSFFNYDIAGGASSFGFIATEGPFTLCAGAPAVLSLTCNPGGGNPADTAASLLESGPESLQAYTATTTSVSLISTSPSPVPEPSTWAMLAIGLAALGWTARPRLRPIGS